MLSKCLNPRCSATFRYLGQGRLFRVDFAEESRKRARNGEERIAPAHGKACPVEHFWLCERCATKMTVGLGGDGEVYALPFEISARMPVAAAVPPAQKRVASAS